MHSKTRGNMPTIYLNGSTSRHANRICWHRDNITSDPNKRMIKSVKPLFRKHMSPRVEADTSLIVPHRIWYPISGCLLSILDVDTFATWFDTSSNWHWCGVRFCHLWSKNRYETCVWYGFLSSVWNSQTNTIVWLYMNSFFFDLSQISWKLMWKIQDRTCWWSDKLAYTTFISINR